MEKAERLESTQNRVGTKRRKKSKQPTDHCLSMEEAERDEKNRINIGHGHFVSY